MVGGTTTTSGTTSPVRLSDQPKETPEEMPVFNHEQCLFCNKLFDTFDSNVAHMQTAHGLFIPDKKHLIVDLETLFSYLHLVIVGYNECICCGTQRNSTLAVQQHMVGKGHCRFDISSQDSEYADFYDLSGSEAESEEDEDTDDTSKPKKGEMENPIVQPDENSLRLPSGRIISNRSQSNNNIRRQLLRSRSPNEPELLEGGSTSNENTEKTETSTSLVTRSGKGGLALTRSEKQESKFAKQRATLSANDERSIAHLSLPEQRSVLAIKQKQVEKAQRINERYRGRLEGLGNQFLMTHFVKDAADKRTLWK
ncbi:uncharacterized protein CTRU02_210353 [Colletotrichum truncatum]|uniref:Uncharacterized protein n=1 Tax=Colletotrichum truncatum TaxID=5467 RepID=A0ACC3YY11_COLTU